MFISFDATHERDRRTHGQTPHDSIGRAYASHRVAKTQFSQKLSNLKPLNCLVFGKIAFLREAMVSIGDL